MGTILRGCASVRKLISRDDFAENCGCSDGFVELCNFFAVCSARCRRIVGPSGLYRGNIEWQRTTFKFLHLTWQSSRPVPTLLCTSTAFSARFRRMLVFFFSSGCKDDGGAPPSCHLLRD
uniref:Uncharacterized protein n=1 Tax=Rhipicephalus zambeziensis TaxID=60191 RepID=A0A224YCX3_9ACAR